MRPPVSRPGPWAISFALLLLGGHSLPAANLSPLALTGFNRDVVVENTASGPPYSSYAVELNPGENLAFYQSGLPGKSYGLPVTGIFTSAVGDGTVFQFEPYTANNVLALSSATGLGAGTLTLVTPATLSRLAIVAHSAGGGGTTDLTLNFTDGTTFTTTYDAPDWFNNANYALAGFERINLTTAATSGATTNPRFYQTTLDLAALLGAGNRPLASLTFTKVASAGSTGIYAVSGEVAAQTPAVIIAQPADRTVDEAMPAGFSVGASGNPFPSLQWYRGATLIPGATNLTYTLPAAALSDHGATFRLVAANVVANATHSATSQVATLTVHADTNAPALLGALSVGLNQVRVRFSEMLLPATANNRLNYSLAGTNGSLVISNAVPDAAGSNVVLTVSAMIDRASYTLTVNQLADRAAAANVIAANSQAAFTASVYAPLNLGDTSPPGSLVPVPGGFNLSGSGADLGSTSDQGQFSYVTRTGDFDVMVRLDSITLADAWTEAGMVVREDLTVGARSASVMATPSISGCYFQSRSPANGATILAGSFPANYPNTWLRLSRGGSTFTGYAGFDGQSWVQLGSASLDLPVMVYFGFAVASHSPGQLASASFRDFADVTSAMTGTSLPREPLAQCSRRTSLVISEFMYHPTNAALEYVELFNSRGEPADLSGFRLAGSVSYTFPPGTTLPGGGFLVVAMLPASLQSTYGLSDVLGPFAGNLPNNSGTILLVNQAGGIVLQCDYSDQSPWPLAADGAGHSLTLARPSYGENNPLAWAASDALGGSPGRLDPFTPDPLRKVVINELLAHTDLPDVDYVEFYNGSAQALDLTGCVLTDDAATNKFLVPGGTVIPAFGFVWFNESQLGFALNAAGETLYFKNPARTRVLDAVRFGGQENSVATGRWPDGSHQFYPLAAQTPGLANAAARASDIVLNELMYHPISGNDDDQYVELHNRSVAPVSLAGWTLADGISYTFPSNAVIAPGGYVVVARSPARLFTSYAGLGTTNTFGSFSGKLASSGERIALTKPDSITSTNASGVVTTNLIAIVVDELTYGTGGRWPGWADGGGSSLERIDPRGNARLPSNWADSDETQKAPWKIVSATGTVDHGSTTADQLQLLLQGAGECLVDNVQVLTAAGSNLVANSTFESGAGGWTAEGTESQSSLETGEGYASTKSYHLRAVDRGDNQVNRVRTPLTASLASGTANVTIRAAVRWLKGHPDLLLRLRGNWLECVGEMDLPVNPGTPGARNSRYVTNAAPAITDVQHSPVLPAAGEAVVVTARVQDPDRLTSVLLRYRLDPQTSYNVVPMTDDGTGGDAVPSDGTYTATLSGRAAGTLIAFYVQATDGFVPAATGTFPADAPSRECLVRAGETQPTGNFPVYRLWMTQATQNTWTSRNKLDNTPFDVTFVLGGDRVIYNAQALYAGSPYIAPGYCGPTCGRCGYTIETPKDDLFLGETALVLDWPGGHGRETTAMQEQMGYWIADRLNLAASHRYTIRLHVNGVTDDARQTIFEASQQPAKGFLEQWNVGATGGPFFKLDRAFEFNDSGSLVTAPGPTLQDFTTTGGLKKREKYRWNFMYRSTDRVNDYTNLFALVDAVNSAAPEPYTSAVNGLADIEQWMRVFATEHIIVNFDAYGHSIGKNMYAYLPPGGKWQLYMCDLDWLMLAAPQYNSSFTASSAPLFNSEDPIIGAMYAFPPFARAYWRAILDAVNGPLAAANCNPLMDAKYQSLVANGVAWCDGQALTDPSAVKTWFAQRRAALQAQLVAVTPAFAVNPSISISNGLGLLTGIAPVGISTVTVNGVLWPVTWTTVTNWTAQLPLQLGSNVFNVAGVDVGNQPVSGASNQVAVTYSGTLPAPVNAVVLNEIMFNPVLSGAEYLELFNTSTNYSYDLSGWSCNGLSYTFPAGSFIAPRSYLVLAKDRVAFNQAYGRAITVHDTFAGSLQRDGETLSVLTTNGSVVDRVRYEAAAPWPAASAGTSLQLVDTTQDNARVANWGVGQSNPPVLPEWVFVSATGVPRPSSTQRALYIYLQSAGDIYLDDLSVVAGNVPGVGTNLATNGGFENTLSPWILGSAGNNSASVLSPNVKHSGNSSLHLIASAGGSGQNSSIWQNFSPALTVGGTYTLSYRYLQTTNGGPLTVRFANNGITTTTNPAPPASSAITLATPGAANSVAATLPAFPAAWLNELQPENITGPLDNFGQREPWLELHNAGTNVLSLTNCFLSDTGTNLTKWAFPATASVAPGGFLLVWCDNQTSQSSDTNLHTNFRLAAGVGLVLLSRSIGSVTQVVDYLTYTNLPSNWSYGDFPDGQPFYRQNLFTVTPAANNTNTSPPITIFINEWMADNKATLPNPLNGAWDDWFELYNPGTNTVDLGGFYLTGNLANKTKFRIPGPARYLVPPGGYLVVWADNNQSQNHTNRPDLHVNFALSKSGEAVGLFAEDGTTIDAVSFGAQSSDVSEGRFPNGASARFFMPSPTPGQPNVIPNTAPVLGPINNYSVHLGQRVVFTATATDAESAVQTLAFSLVGAPAGASIDPASGAFAWTAMGVPVPSTNAVTVRVADNGTPPLSASRTFLVMVAPLPQLGPLSPTDNGRLRLSFQSLASQSYQLEFKDVLDEAGWTPLGMPVLGTGDRLEFNESVEEAEQRFYRLRCVP